MACYYQTLNNSKLSIDGKVNDFLVVLSNIKKCYLFRNLSNVW